MKDYSDCGQKKHRDIARESSKSAVEDAINISKDSGAAWDGQEESDLERDYSGSPSVAREVAPTYFVPLD